MADRRAKVLASLATALATVAMAAPAVASNWVDALAAGSTAEAHALTLAAPAGIAAACASPSGSVVTVTWNPVVPATGYSVLQSTTSAGGPYKVVASGLAGTSWGSGRLSTGNYWFEVTASVGVNWSGAASPASPETTVVKNKSCAQP